MSQACTETLVVADAVELRPLADCDQAAFAELWMQRLQEKLPQAEVPNPDFMLQAAQWGITKQIRQTQGRHPEYLRYGLHVNEEPAGIVGVRLERVASSTLEWWLRRPQQQLQTASRALRRVVEHSFTDHDRSSIRAIWRPDDVVSAQTVAGIGIGFQHRVGGHELWHAYNPQPVANVSGGYER